MRINKLKYQFLLSKIIYNCMNINELYWLLADTGRLIM